MMKILKTGIVGTSLALLMLLAAAQVEAANPTEVKMAVIFGSPIESPWNTAFMQTMERIKAEKPHGLAVGFDYTESVKRPDAERILRDYANTGKYPIMWAHSTFSDAVNVLRKEYPDLLWVVTGGGNEKQEANGYWFDAVTHEPAYLLGVAAGMMTKSNVIGGVAAFPYPNENIPMNAFVDGAKSVNPKINAKVTYIGAWFDPPKTKESAKAQIAAGADMIFATRFGVFEAAEEGKALVFGYMVDQHKVNPKVVVSSAMVQFDPAVKFAIDEWWKLKTQGKKYAAPKDQPITFTMAEGGSALAPFHAFKDTLPKDVLAKVEQAKAEILSGKLKVPLNGAPIK